MYEYILNKAKPDLKPFDSEALWLGPLNGIIEESIILLEQNKIGVVTYKAFPPPFSEQTFRKFQLIMRGKAEFRVILVNSLDEFKEQIEGLINLNSSGFIICSNDLWQKVIKQAWFPLIDNFTKKFSTIQHFGISPDSFLRQFDYMVSSGYQGLSQELRKKFEQFDLSELFFMPIMAKYCRERGIQLDLKNLNCIIEFLGSFVNLDNYAFPTFDSLSNLNNNPICAIIIREPLNISELSIDVLNYQTLISSTDYLNLKILGYIYKQPNLNPELIDWTRVLSKDFAVYSNKVRSIISKESNGKLSWFIARSIIESYLACQNPPRISDHNLSYNLWSVFPDNIESAKVFEDSVLSIAKTLQVETNRRDLSNLGKKILSGKLPSIFMTPYWINVTYNDQREFFKTILNEILTSIFKRWEVSTGQVERNRNSEVLLKTAEILSILHLLSDICQFDCIQSELKNPESSLFNLVRELVKSSEGDHVSSLHVERFESLLNSFSKLYPCWEEILAETIQLREAAKVYEEIFACKLEPEDIGTFCQVWAENLREDVEKEQAGEVVNVKKWRSLSRKYNALANDLILNILQGKSSQFPQLHQTWAVADEHLRRMHAVFIIIVDSMSMVDWCAVKKNLNLQDFKVNEKFAVSSIPTETPVGHATIFSGLCASKCGVMGRTVIDSKGTPLELMVMNDDSEDDTQIKRTGEFKYKTEYLHKLLLSNNLEKKPIVISPFKETRLTQALKALISSESDFLDVDYKEDRKLDDTVRLICAKIACLNKKRVLGRTTVILFPNIDSRGHTGEWDNTIYFQKMEQEVNKILATLRVTLRKEKLDYGIIITSDHGKLLRWEMKKILQTLNCDSSHESFGKIASIATEELGKSHQLHPPVKSAKYLMAWVKDEDLIETSTRITAALNEKMQMDISSSNRIKMFTGDDVLRILGNDHNSNLRCPNLLLFSLYQFDGPGQMQHSGLSLGELLVPLISLELKESA